MRNTISYIECENCSKPLLLWDGRILVDNKLYGQRVPFLKILCFGCLNHIDTHQNGKNLYHYICDTSHYLTYGKNDVYSETLFEEFEDSALEKHNLISEKSLFVSDYQKSWIEHKKKSQTNIPKNEKQEISEQIIHKFQHIAGNIGYRRFMHTLFELHDRFKELPKPNLDFLDRFDNEEKVQEQKPNFDEEKKKALNDSVSYYLCIYKNDSLSNSENLISTVSSIFEQALSNNLRVDEALVWIKLEIINYAFENFGLLLDHNNFED